MVLKRSQRLASRLRHRVRRAFLRFDSGLGFTFQPKCIVVVAGVSGAGKSTLIRSLLLGRTTLPIELPRPFRAPLSKHLTHSKTHRTLPGIYFGTAMMHVELSQDPRRAKSIEWLHVTKKSRERILVILNPSLDELNQQRLRRFNNSSAGAVKRHPTKITSREQASSQRAFWDLIRIEGLAFQKQYLYEPKSGEFRDLVQTKGNQGRVS